MINIFKQKKIKFKARINWTTTFTCTKNIEPQWVVKISSNKDALKMIVFQKKKTWKAVDSLCCLFIYGQDFYCPMAMGQMTFQHDCEANMGNFLAKTQTNISKLQLKLCKTIDQKKTARFKSWNHMGRLKGYLIQPMKLWRSWLHWQWS